MRFAWHGNAAVTLELSGHRLVIDPFFSTAEPYGEWYRPNPSGMRVEAFLGQFPPHTVILTHGHWDHFDPEALKAIEAAVQPRYVGTHEAVAALDRLVGVPAARCLSLEPGESVTVPGPANGAALTLRAWQGDHWFTGPEGTEVARKLMHRYGAMPCGGYMLELLLSDGHRQVFLSGDTLVAAVPELPGTDLAILNVTSRIPHPRTHEYIKCGMDPGDLPAAAARLRPRHLAVVHWDYPAQERPITRAELEQAAAGLPLRLHLPGYHAWVEPEPLG